VRELESATSIIERLPQAEVYLIGGPSGAGKSVFAQTFAMIRPVLIIPLDDYFVNEDAVRFSSSRRYGLGRQWDHPSSLDLELAIQNVLQLLKKNHAHLPLFSFAENERTGYRVCRLRSGHSILVEGLHALLLRSKLRAAGCNVYSIFINAHVGVRRNRVSIRDSKTRKRPLSDFERRFYFMRIAETRWILPQRRDADLVLDTSGGAFGITNSHKAK
jgi:uridine kinase